jgi:hypothetical protein
MLLILKSCAIVILELERRSKYFVRFILIAYTLEVSNVFSAIVVIGITKCVLHCPHCNR